MYYNRRITINPRSFSSSDVNVTANTITIAKHGYVNGQKVVSTATTSPGGLVDNGIYYAYIVDEDTIKLSSTYYDSINPAPKVINITSASDGTISPINPLIKTERNLCRNMENTEQELKYKY